MAVYRPLPSPMSSGSYHAYLFQSLKIKYVNPSSDMLITTGDYFDRFHNQSHDGSDPKLEELIPEY